MFIWSRNREGIDVSSYGHAPFNIFSPYSHSEKHKIPVPGNESERADSVEGIWQGLKDFGAGIDTGLFHGRPRKRKGLPKGHVYKDRIIGLSDARRQIYMPAYTYHVVNNALTLEVVQRIEDLSAEGNVLVYDFNGGTIDDLTQPLSHASLLADILNVLMDAPLPPFSKEKFTYMDEQVEAVTAYRERISQIHKNILDTIATFAYLHAPEKIKQLFALKAIHKNFTNNGSVRVYKPTAATKAFHDKVIKTLDDALTRA